MTARRILVLLTLAAPLALGTLAAGAASFRPDTTVQGESVTLGDLFDDAGAAAGQVIARAPAPGRRMIFDSHSLAALAQAYNLNWRPASPHDRAVVERSAIVVGSDRIESLMQDALAAKGVARPFAIRFDHRDNQIDLPSGSGDLTIQSLSYDEDQKRFSATLTAASPDGPIAIPVSGVTAPMIEVPVLNRHLDPDEIIGIADIDLVQMAGDNIARDTLMKTEDIVGHSVERPLEPRRALRARDLKRDLVVHRGQTVTLALDDPNISISTSARALTDGAKGEAVKVLNLASSRVVEGVAAGPDLVTVSENIVSIADQGATR